MLASDLLSFYLLQIRSQLSCEGVRERNVSEMNTDTENTETEARDIPTPEQCFYASFKIYLSDSRTNSICELEDSDSVQSEVVRIEKTLEVLNVTDSEEEKTISISPVNRNPDDDTDLDVDDVEIEHFYYKPRLVITNSDRSLKRSLSESDESQDSPTVTNRNSRCVEKLRNRRYESTQSMDRARSERSPVFYLDPLDWIRTEGSSPLPVKEKLPAKVLGGLGGKSLDILTESEENLNTEIEMINRSGRALECLRNSSEPTFRHVTPTIELTPDTDLGYSSQDPASNRSRSLTSGNLPASEKKTRRTTFPLLCSRPGSARKKSFLSSEDLRRTSAYNLSASNLQHIGSIDVPGNTSNLLRMRNSTLGNSAPSLSDSNKELSVSRRISSRGGGQRKSMIVQTSPILARR